MWFRQGTLKMKTEKKRETDSQAKIVIGEIWVVNGNGKKLT